MAGKAGKSGVVKMKPTIIYRTDPALIKRMKVLETKIKKLMKWCPMPCPTGYTKDPNGKCQPQGSG